MSRYPHSTRNVPHVRTFAEKLEQVTTARPVMNKPNPKLRQPYVSGRTILAGSGYRFNQPDPSRMHLGISLRDYKQRMQSAFVITALIIMLIELALLAWPIVATVLWTFEAAINWVWFLYFPRAALLLWAIITSTSLAVEKLWGMGTFSWKEFYRVYGSFAPSGALIGWSTLAFSAGCILGGIATIVSAALYTFYTSKVLYGLSVGIGALSVVESFVAPFALFHFGVIIPVNQSRKIELERRKANKYNPVFER